LCRAKNAKKREVCKNLTRYALDVLSFANFAAFARLKFTMLYPFVFQPIFKERVWGGRELEKLYGKKIPAGKPIGESWEISDRPGDESVIVNGPLAGKNLRWLMENHAAEILGGAKPATGNRFPLLCKILDARDKLSLQVHPPADKAAELGGEPKTEMWFIADAAPGAELYVGLKRGVTRAEFEQKISDGSVADCFQRVPVRAGDAMFLPSGRVHAIGAGLVIFEIQQNSDTTYRVFDWNRVGLDGQPRELHVAQSLASIDFNDFEPKLAENKFHDGPHYKSRHVVQDTLFNIDEWTVETSEFMRLGNQQMRIIALVKGGATIIGGSSGISVELKPGQFCLTPASLKGVEIKTKPQTTFLCVEAN
jgi:mannose-6-phosphate isomerase